MIVTHTNPDMDAIAGVWLLKKFGGLQYHEVVFVNTGNPDRGILNKANAVVDTGRDYDPDNMRFDHHHFKGSKANETCAALQVYQHLSQHLDLGYLKPLMDVIFAGDTGRNEANQSREIGIHAMLSGFKQLSIEAGQGFVPNEKLMDHGCFLLDTLEVHLRRLSEARKELVEKVVYRSIDNKVWAIKHGSQGSTFAAFDEGAEIVVFEGKPVEVEGGTTYPIGIMRKGELTSPNVGHLAERTAVSKPLAAEIGKWFKHPAGFFAGRGTPKAPVFEPVEVDIAQLAKLIDDIWVR